MGRVSSCAAAMTSSACLRAWALPRRVASTVQYAALLLGDPGGEVFGEREERSAAHLVVDTDQIGAPGFSRLTRSNGRQRGVLEPKPPL
jgi:hypothetical protein